MLSALLRCQPDLCRLPGVDIPSQEQAGSKVGGRLGRCLGLCHFSDKFWHANGTGWQMHKTKEFVAIEQHSWTSGLTANHILDMILEKSLGGWLPRFRPDVAGTSRYITG